MQQHESCEAFQLVLATQARLAQAQEGWLWAFQLGQVQMHHCLQVPLLGGKGGQGRPNEVVDRHQLKGLPSG